MDALKKDLFRSLCLKVADETDPKKIELLKQRMRILLQESGTEVEEESDKVIPIKRRHSPS